MSTAQSTSFSLTDFEYEVIDTGAGTIRRFVYENGTSFEEYTSHWKIAGIPFYHRTSGRQPETGKLKTAQGVIAVGRKAIGIVAVGQLAIGFLTFGQLSLGVLLGIGQASTGVVAVGQLGLSGLFALAQFGVGSGVIGQFGYGQYVLAQFGAGRHVWDMRAADPAAVQFFESLFKLLQ